MAKTVLIADDNEIIRRDLCEAFTLDSDFAVCGEACDGPDVMDKTQQSQPDLIILELSLPVRNGLDVARALKELLPSSDRHIRVLC